MRKLLCLKLLSWLLLTVILTAMTHGLCDEAHAMTAIAHGAGSEINAPHHLDASAAADQTEAACSCASECKDCPQDDHNGGSCDGDGCTNCICHTSSLLHQFDLVYIPFSSDLLVAQSFQELPEVYLTRFIPPQNTI